VPQLLKLLRSRDASGVSTRMYAISAAGFTLWTIYGVGLGATVLVASNLICLGLVGTILGLRLRFRQRGGPQPAPADQAATT
jgi:MtN3 and saliva related transmembrane protein